MKNILPALGKEGISPAWFPTTMQAFIFRNWNTVDKKRIAEVIETSVENVEREALRMGLGEQGDVSPWAEKGYITIIRANWHILPYEQLLALLSWSEEKLAHILKEDDFLGIKLGDKPVCEKLLYRELTEKEKKETEKIRAEMEEIAKITPPDSRAPFDFAYSDLKIEENESFEEKAVLDGGWYISDNTGDAFVKKAVLRFSNMLKSRYGVALGGKAREISLSFIEGHKEEYHEIKIEKEKIEIKAGALSGIIRGLYRLDDLMNLAGGAELPLGEFKREPRFESRFIYSFCGLYERAFEVDSREYCPDSLLEQYARVGVNGIWLQAILYKLTEFPFDPSVSKGFEERQKRLIDFVNRAKEYGIKIYLYLNEPRGMTEAFYEKYPHLKGSVGRGNPCMCVSAPETVEYIRSAVASLCRTAPDLGGFFTICMSENPTHCKYNTYVITEPCERCKDKKPWQLVSIVNTAIAEAVQSVNGNMKVMAWDWGWSQPAGFEEGDVEALITSLPGNVAVMCKRETFIPFTRGGIEGTVRDYSISVDGLSEDSVKGWSHAKKEGHQTVVKIQPNNTWECSTTPYIPVYRKIFEQMRSLIHMNVDHLMLSWTLGGYPSPTIKMLSELFFIENGNAELDFDKAIKMVYGKKAEEVKKATDIFGDAFSEFPNNISVIHKGPQNGGPSVPLFHKPTGYKSTMTCYTFDDIENWRGIYPVDILKNQYKLVSDGFEKGMALISDKNSEFYDISFVSYSLFRASFNQVRFIRCRDEFIENKSDAVRKELIEIVKDEKELAKEVYKIMCRRPEVGYEAANHYYFSLDSLTEKVINCRWLEEYYENKRA